MMVRSAFSLSAFLALSLLVGLGITAFNTGSTAGEASKGGPIYAQLSSLLTQKVGTSPTLVKMESNDAIQGISHSDKEKNTDIVIKTPGVYFIMAAAQVGRDSGTSDDHVDLWVKVNGKDVDNSNTRQTVKDAKFTAVLVCQGIAECKAGDVINAVIASSSPKSELGIMAITPKGEPAIPSIILSMYKIN